MAYPHYLEQFLAGTQPFSRLPEDALRELTAGCLERRFDKGQTIFQEGQPSQSVWVLKKGRVHLVHHLKTGRVSTTCVIVPQEMFCCLPALDQREYPATAVAAVDSVVVQIPTTLFHRAMAKQPAFAQQTLCTVCDRLRQIEFRGCLSQEAVPRRLAQTLLTLAKKFGMEIPMTRQELADLSGTTVETVIRTLSAFQKSKLVRRSARGTVQISSVAALQRYLAG